jgi:hypothetical protein
MAVTINIPSQVKTSANLAAFPASGSLKTIYIAEDTNKTYRWDGSTYVEISASAATGLTIGTTPIASGTIGRVLFQGTGNVLQQSSSLFWDSTNNRLGIGTSSPATGTLLDVIGQIKASVLRCDVINNTSNTITMLWFTGSGNRVYDNSGTQVLNLRGGNLQIGTTTDAGFKLDVNGTARVQGNFDNTVSSVGFKLLQISGNPSLQFWQGVSRFSFTRTGNNGMDFASISGYCVHMSPTGTLIGGTSRTDINDSAQLDVISTTKGFLPPRMTTTQRNAIASPAAGLIVYDTTLNLPHFFNGTIWVSL